MNLWLAVFLGGGAGSVARFALSRILMPVEGDGAFPWATLAANLLATALLAWLIQRFEVHLPHKEQWRALLAVGFCGGFSTLSTFSYENFRLLRDGSFVFATLNILVSVVAGILLFHLFARSA
ncbi:MAG: fluoride efflux transporter CrcB [Bacteroidetes bacterium]|nr:fluoride efflux transporter CrcB [Bacteroidota bacterium]MCC6654945.1 fluoride efflux transporter CrcB [Flavobacteriales bacterium]HMU15058.1 fluoride efflux transporter CrcB [Flavobacteriales bacterium]